MSSEELHDKIMQRIHDIWQDDYLNMDEFEIAYVEIRRQIEDEEY